MPQVAHVLPSNVRSKHPILFDQQMAHLWTWWAYTLPLFTSASKLAKVQRRHARIAGMHIQLYSKRVYQRNVHTALLRRRTGSEKHDFARQKEMRVESARLVIA